MHLRLMEVEKLKVARCSYEAAKYAVMNWHYSKAMPSSKLIRYGVWENEKFIGTVIFGRGANNAMLRPWGLTPEQGCELVRVALKKHEAPVTQIIAITLRMLKKENPGLKLIVSFADERQGHEGIIYKAGNWVYDGRLKSTPEYFFRGRWMHQRTVNSLISSLKKLPEGTERRDGGYRKRFLYYFDKDLEKRGKKVA